VYRLYYWPGLPGRGEFVRLVLEQSGAPYEDVARLPESQGGGAAAVTRVLKGDLGGVVPFAPPILQDGSLVISQSANICRYVGLRHDLWSADPALDALELEIQLTIADLVHEVHGTHHPVSPSLYYEEQREPAVESARRFREHRMLRFLSWLEGVLDRNGGTWLIGDKVSSVDLAAFQSQEGLEYAFPKAWESVLPRIPLLNALRARVRELPRVAAYLASTRRLGFNEHGIFRRYPELDL